jgi:RNA polymerase sigma-70 factor (ECF subfamily)
VRAVFVLSEIEEMTMAEIAVLTGTPPGTVASRLRRARALFREQVGLLHERERTGRP